MKIYKDNELIIDVVESDSSVRKRVLMGDNYVLLSFYHSEFIDFKKGCYITYKNFRYELMTNVYPEYQESTGGWKYDIQFDAVDGFLRKYNVMYRKQGIQEVEFALTANLLSFGNLICDCINYELGGENWVTKEVPEEYSEITKLVSFKGEKLFDGLTIIAEAFECEWWTEQNGDTVMICFGKLEFGTEEEFEQGKVVKSMPRSNGDSSNYGTRFFVFGSTRNLTKDYGQTEQGGVTNHISEIRLRLPDNQRYVDAWEPLAREDVVQQVAIFDDIYPKNTETATSVEEAQRATEDGTEFTAYILVASNTPFTPNDMIEGEILGCVFESGTLQGREFELIVNTTNFDKKFEIKAIVEGEGESEIIVPNEFLKPKTGDKFVITGVKLPQSRIEEAEQELLKAGKAWAIKNSKDTSVYDCSTNPVFCQVNDKNYDLGQKVKLIGSQFGDGRNSRIQGYEKKIHNEYEATYTIGDNTAYSRIAAVEGELKESQYAERIGVVEGTGIYLIHSKYDNTIPTEYNTYSALALLKKFVTYQGYVDQPLRTFDDVKFKSLKSTEFESKVKGWIIDALGNAEFRDILGRVITITGGLMTDDFIAGMTGVGTGIVNKSELHTDRGVFRKYIEVLALVVSKMYWRGGRQCLSPAGMKVSKVEEYADYWRLYMETEDGQTNEFTVGAQARCNNYGNGTQKYYWRLVTGIGSNYIDLSKTDRDTGSGVPAVGDDVVQFGHRTDPYLQWVVMDSSFPDDAGRTIYAGVNSYDLSDKMVLRIGVDPKDQNRIGLFTRHGEFSDVIDGINQDIEDNQQAIQDAKDAADAIQSVVDNLTGIIIPDMQNQLDGAIQSWDGEVEPTLNNYPANEWFDEETGRDERAKHVGDTYIYYTTDSEGNTVSSRYNFRFVDGVYKWEKIADSVSAELEVKLRELTGTVGKKNSITYSNNVPTPAYNIDDLWIKEDGSMYICRTQKMDGMQGSSADWELFNDTMLRLAKMSDDGIISKEEKATLRDTWNQIQKEFTSYQAQATKYGVSITALQNAYNTLNTFLTNTVKLSQNIDTSLTVAQKTEYNQDFANYYSERTAFANVIAQKVADDSVSNLQIGSVNLISRKMMLAWNEKNKDIAAWGQDKDGVYLSVKQNLLYENWTEGENKKDIFGGKIKFKENTQYVLSAKFKMAAAQQYGGLYLIFIYTDGTYKSLNIYGNETTLLRRDIVSDKGKTISHITSSFGGNNHPTLVYSLGLFEGNKPLPEIPVATEDLTGQSNVNLVDGGKEFIVTAGANSNYAYKVLTIPVLKPNTVYNISFKAENLVGNPDKYTAIFYKKDISSSVGNLLDSSSGGILISSNNFTEGEYVLLLYAGVSGSTAGNSVKFSEVMLVEGFTAPSSYSPSPGDVAKDIKDVSDAVSNLSTTITGAFKDGIIDEAEAKAIASNINILNAEKADIDAYYTKLYANAYLTGTAKTNLASAKTAYNTAHANLISSINTAIADGKATAAEKADVNAKFTAYNTALSTYKTRVGEADKAIQDRIKELAELDATNKVDNIQVGGTNLFPISKLNPVSYRTGSSKEGSGSEIIFKCNTPSAWAILSVSIPTPVVPTNTDFIISMDIRNTNVFCFEVTATSGTQTIFDKINFENTTSTWKRISKRYNSGDKNNIGGINLWGVGDVRHIKIEIGNKATDWSPAPEDVDQSIQDAIAKTVDITAPSQVFKYGAGYTGTPIPASIVLTAIPRNFTPTSYQWQYLNGSTWTNISGATSSTYTVSPGNTTFFPSGTNVRTFRCICNGDEKLSDSFTLAKLADGEKGATGSTGATGKGVKSITNYYLASASSSGVTVSTSGWTTTIQTISTSKRYLWNYEVVTYTDNSTTTTTPVIIGVYGNTGATGSTGAAGRGITSITEYYAISSSNTTSPTSWSTTVPTTTTTNKYLWNYEKITYTDGTTEDTAKRVIGTHGATGSTGAAGKDAYTVLLGNESHAFAGSTAAALAGSTTCSVMAYKGATQVAATVGTISGLPTGMTASIASNGTTAPVITFTVTTSMKTASGTVNIPVTVDGKVFTKVFSYSIAFKGATGATGSKGDKGDKGDTGTAGKGVKSVTEQYYLSTSSTTQTGGSWSSTMPAWTTGKYLWTRLITTYTDNSTTTSNPILDPLNEAVDKAETLSKDDIAKQLGFTNFEALKNKNGYIDMGIIDADSLITNTAWVNSLSAKILTANAIKANMIASGAITATKIYVEGFTFANNNIIGGSDFGEGAGIKIISTTSERSFKAYKDASNYISMYYNSANDWGLKGVVEGSELLKLGTKSMISGWEMSTTGFQSSDFVQPTWSGSAISGGKGSKLFPDGGIMLMPSGTGILPLSSGVMQAGLIKVEGDNSMLVGLEIVARGNGYLKDIVALKLSAMNDYSSPSKYPTALEIASGDFNIYSGGIYMKAPWNNLSMQNYSYVVGGCGHVPTSIRQTGSTNCYLDADQTVVLVNNSQHFNVFLPDARNLKPGHTVKFIPLQSSYSHGIIADSGNYGAKIRYKNSLYDWVYVNSVSGGRTAIIECTYIGIFGGYRNWVAGVLNQDGISYGSN